MAAEALSLRDTYLLSQSRRHQSQCNTKDVLFSLTSAIWQTQTDWHSREVYYLSSTGGCCMLNYPPVLLCVTLPFTLFLSDHYVRMHLISRHTLENTSRLCIHYVDLGEIAKPFAFCLMSPSRKTISIAREAELIYCDAIYEWQHFCDYISELN